MVADADKRKLDAMSRTHSHQGVIAVAAVRADDHAGFIAQQVEDRVVARLPLFYLLLGAQDAAEEQEGSSNYQNPFHSSIVLAATGACSA